MVYGHYLLKASFRVIEGTIPGIIHTILPNWIFKMFPTLAQRNIATEVTHDNLATFRASIQEHEDTLDEHNPRDFIDASLMEISKTDDPKSSFYKETGRENLVNTVNDLFIGGSETTSNSLLWALLYMIREPHVQKRVHVSHKSCKAVSEACPSYIYIPHILFGVLLECFSKGSSNIFF